MLSRSCQSHRIRGRVIVAALFGLTTGACGTMDEPGEATEPTLEHHDRLPATGGGTPSEEAALPQPSEELSPRCRATSVRLYYSGTARAVERLSPMQVSLCLAGGANDLAISYTEEAEAHELRMRSVQYSYDGQRARELGLPRDPLAVGLELERTFGVDPSTALDSSTLRQDGTIPAGQKAVFYRQTTQLERVAQIIAHTSCGVRVSLGYVKLSDWSHTAELATGESCPPPTRLPPAAKFTAKIQ